MNYMSHGHIMTKHEFENLKTGDLLKSKFSIFIFMSARHIIDISKLTSYYVTRQFDLRKSRMVYINLCEPWNYFVKI